VIAPLAFSLFIATAAETSADSAYRFLRGSRSSEEGCWTHNGSICEYSTGADKCYPSRLACQAHHDAVQLASFETIDNSSMGPSQNLSLSSAPTEIDCWVDSGSGCIWFVGASHEQCYSLRLECQARRENISHLAHAENSSLVDQQASSEAMGNSSLEPVQKLSSTITELSSSRRSQRPCWIRIGTRCTQSSRANRRQCHASRFACDSWHRRRDRIDWSCWQLKSDGLCWFQTTGLRPDRRQFFPNCFAQVEHCKAFRASKRSLCFTRD